MFNNENISSLMMFDHDYLKELCKKYGVKPKILRDRVFPDEKTRGLSYFNNIKSVTNRYLELIADTLGCTTDEILRRPVPGTQIISGDNNQVGNVTVNNDVENMRVTIQSQREIIKSQKEEIKRLNKLYEQQMKIKDNQINSLIEFSKKSENQ